MSSNLDTITHLSYIVLGAVNCLVVNVLVDFIHVWCSNILIITFFRLGFIGKSVSCQPMGLVLRLVTSNNHFKKSGLIYVLRCLKKAKIKCIQRVTIFLPLNKTDEMIRMN